MNLTVNSSLGRAADYSNTEEVEGTRVGKVRLYAKADHGAVGDITFNGQPYDFVETVEPPAAHKWMQGYETRGDVKNADPTPDEMMEVIARQLRTECAIVMEHALSSPEALTLLYNAAKPSPRKKLASLGGHIKSFKLMRPCW